MEKKKKKKKNVQVKYLFINSLYVSKLSLFVFLLLRVSLIFHCLQNLLEEITAFLYFKIIKVQKSY